MIREIKPTLPPAANDGQIRAELARLKINFKRRGRGPGGKDLDTTNDNLAVIRARMNATVGQEGNPPGNHARHLMIETLTFFVDDNGDVMSYKYKRD